MSWKCAIRKIRQTIEVTSTRKLSTSVTSSILISKNSIGSDLISKSNSYKLLSSIGNRDLGEGAQKAKRILLCALRCYGGHIEPFPAQYLSLGDTNEGADLTPQIFVHKVSWFQDGYSFKLGKAQEVSVAADNTCCFPRKGTL